MTVITADLTKRINEALEDLEEILDFHVEDVDSDITPDPELVNIVIKGRLKQALGSSQKEDPASDYDRAMKGLSPCIQSLYTKSNN